MNRLKNSKLRDIKKDCSYIILLTVLLLAEMTAPNNMPGISNSIFTIAISKSVGDTKTFNLGQSFTCM